MPKKPTPADANLILKLYDLRREAEIRKARNWWFAEFWPETADDFMKVAQAIGTKENAWLRQVPSYWELAAATIPSSRIVVPKCSIGSRGISLENILLEGNIANGATMLPSVIF